MKPANFTYLDPSNLKETVALLKDYGEEGKILAGGQSLIPLMNFRLAKPQTLIDINKIKELNYIREENGYIAIGALVRERAIELSPLIKEKCPLLQEAASLIGYPAIRNRGTIGGNMSHADPVSEFPAVAMALEAEFKITGNSGEKTVKAGEFFLSYLTTSIEVSEILTEVRIPVFKPRTGSSFIEIVRRQGDHALVGVCVALTLDESKKCKDARIVFAGEGATPMRDLAAENVLRGYEINESKMREAARLAGENVEPEGDIHASAEYKRDMARVLTIRAIKTALERVEL